MQAREQTIEQDVAGFSGEDAIEAGAQGSGPLGIGPLNIKGARIYGRKIKRRTMAPGDQLRLVGKVSEGGLC
jgi:hypothetical protein